MANIYVYSAAAGAGTGADWTNAYTTLKAAAEAAGTAAGDSLWVAHDHAETLGAAISITFKGTSVSPSQVICVNRAGSVPPVAADIRTTATVTTTGAFAMTLLGGSGMYFEGIIFACGTGATTAVLTIGGTVGSTYIWRSCVFRKLGTTANSNGIVYGSGRGKMYFYNCNFEFGSTGDGMTAQGYVEWNGGTIAGATIPTILFRTGGTISRYMYINGVDLSPMGANTIVGSAVQTQGQIVLNNCKLAASTVVAAVPTSEYSSPETWVIRSDSGDTNYRTEKYSYAGTMTTETAIVRTGGASDGTTPVAWKIVTTANAERLFPFESFPLLIWNETTTALAISLYGYWNDPAVPTSAQIWMTVEYLGTSGFPISSFISSGPATVLTAGSNITEDTTSTWGGGDTTTRFKMTVNPTIAEKGPFAVRVYVAAASKTFYVDPKIEVV